MPGQPSDQLLKGNLWTKRTSGSVWTSMYWVLDGKTLTVFDSETSPKPIQTLQVEGGQVVEVKLQSGSPQMYERALLLKAFEQSTAENTSLRNGHFSRQICEHIMAAEDSVAHLTWQAHLSRAVALGGSKLKNGLQNSAAQQQKRARATFLFGPSPHVVMRMCCAGAEFAKQLQQRLKVARCAFEEGLRNPMMASQHAREAQRGLYNVDGLLLTISRTLADSHCAEEQSEADAEALGWCQEWVAGLQAFVMNLDHQLETMVQRDTTSQMPNNWCSFAQNSIMQLCDIEDAMETGHSQWQRHNIKKRGSDWRPSEGEQRCRIVQRSAMPYSYWASATAI